MPRMSVQDRRRELVAAAIRVIARDGAAAASTRAIVAEAGMALASFHYAFASRDELLIAAIEQVTEGERWVAELAYLPHLAEAGAPAPRLEDLLRAGFDAYIDLLVADPGREQASIELALHGLRAPGGPAVVRRQYAVYRRSGAQLLDLVAQLSGRAWSMPTAEIVRHLVVFTDGLTLTWLADRDTAGARRTAALAARALAGFALPPDLPADLPADRLTHLPAPAAPAPHHPEGDQPC